MASITEVADDIYRVNVEITGSPVTYSFFVIKDDLPTLVETGFGRLFNETVEAVKKVIDPSTLRYIVVPHFEGDESGALNHFLGLAPNAQPVCSPIGALTSVADFAIREPVVVDEDQVLDLGQHRLGFLITPYVHTWDSMLPYDQSTSTVFCSDVFIQPGLRPPTTGEALVEEMLAAYRMVGIFPSRAHLNSALDKIEALDSQVLACHHGSVITGQIQSYIQALREHDVTGVTAWNPMRERAY
jgi:flavorubredoxin